MEEENGGKNSLLKELGWEDTDSSWQHTFQDL